MALNHQANLETLLHLIENGLEVLGMAWEGSRRITPENQAEIAKLNDKLQDIHRLASQALEALDAGDADAELEQVEFLLKDAGRSADRVRFNWKAADDQDSQLGQFIGLL